MAFVICEPCIGTKDRACVAVCPVDCIYEGVHSDGARDYDMLFIAPRECIDCGLCKPECPVDAIFQDEEVPQQWTSYIAINAAFCDNNG